MIRLPFALPILSIGIALSAASTAAQDASDAVTLDTITVIGTGLETRVFENPATVSVVDQEEIARTPPISTAELLRSVPGIQITYSAVPGLQRISIRGEDSRRVVIKIDGQALTDQTTRGQPILVDPAIVERIEVVRGSASVVSGSRAIGGVINIVTKRGGERPIEGALSGAVFSPTEGYKATASAFGAHAGFDYRFTASRSEQGDRETPDGPLKPSDFDDSNLSGHLGYRFGRHYVSGKVQRYALSANAFTGDPDFSVSLPQRDLTKGALFYEGRDLATWLPRLTVDGYVQTIDRTFENRIAQTTFLPFPPPGTSTTLNIATEN